MARMAPEVSSLQDTKLNKEDGELQVCTLLYSLGKEAEQVYKTFTFLDEDEEDPNDYETVMAKLDNYFVPKVNTIHERARFHQRTQKPGETAEEYIRSLHDLADTCAFADAKNENICDTLVIGILDKELSEKLQLMPDLTLNKAVELVRQSEQVKQHVSEQGANANCAQMSEVAHKRAPCRDKQKHISGHGQNKGAKGKQGHCANKGHKCSRCGRVVTSGVIQPVKEPTEWCAPMVAVPKKNKDQPRICVDLKMLNKAVKREKYVLPTIDDILPKSQVPRCFLFWTWPVVSGRYH